MLAFSFCHLQYWLWSRQTRGHDGAPSSQLGSEEKISQVAQNCRLGVVLLSSSIENTQTD